MKSKSILILFLTVILLGGMAVEGTSAEKKPVVALALSGGAAWGFSHIGVIAVLEEYGVEIDIVTGNSAGAIVGSLYAAGLTAGQMKELVADLRWWDFLQPTISELGFFNPAGIKRNIKEQIPHDDFEQLEKSFGVVTADLIDGEVFIFTEGSVSTAVAASSAQPIIFKPVEYEGRLLVDGGIIINLPDDLAWEMGADIVIAVNLNENFSFYGAPQSHLDVAIRTYNIMQGGRARRVNADVIIAPELTGVRGAQIEAYEEIIAAGREAAWEKIGEILQVLEQYGKD